MSLLHGFLLTFGFSWQEFPFLGYGVKEAVAVFLPAFSFLFLTSCPHVSVGLCGCP